MRNRLQRTGLCLKPQRTTPETRSQTLSEVKITVMENGSYKVEGGVPLFDADGNRIETREGKPFSLCRCGQSANKPFCDGTHKRIEWDGGLARK